MTCAMLQEQEKDKEQGETGEVAATGKTGETSTSDKKTNKFGECLLRAHKQVTSTPLKKTTKQKG